MNKAHEMQSMHMSFEAHQFSVIIPTWNRAGTIAAAIRSALDQTRPPLEVLVCDDGSTDASETIVRAIGDDRVRWIPGTRGGRPAIPRNRGIGVARGEWLAFLDSDDVWLPEKLELQLTAAEKAGTRAVCANALTIRPDGSENGVLLSIADTRLAWRDLFQGNRVVCSSAVLHRSLFPSLEGFPEARELKAIEDYALWLRAATHSDFSYVGKPLVRYLDDAANSVRAEELDRWGQRAVVFGDLLAWARRHPTDIPQAVLRAARRERFRARVVGEPYRLRLKLARFVRSLCRVSDSGVSA